VGLLVGIPFPEVYLYTAFYEYLDAKIALENIPAKIRTLWTTMHVYYANSGGFAIEYTAQGEHSRHGKLACTSSRALSDGSWNKIEST
jgi:hypothetical protein